VVNTTLVTANKCKYLGHEITYISNPFKAEIFHQDFQVYYSFLTYTSTKMGTTLYGSPFKPELLETFTKGAVNYFWENKWIFTGAIYRLKKFKKIYQNLFKKYDVLLSPVLSTPPVKIGYLGPNVPFEKMIKRLNAYVNFTLPQNIAGAPAVSLPLGSSEKGLPIGVQFAGEIGDETRLLQLSYQLEKEGLFVSFEG